MTNSAGTIHYVLNEAADDVQVAFDDGSLTNDLGSQTVGVQSFSLGAHTNYSIMVSKHGSGTPNQISADGTFNDFYGPRGVGVNRNPKTHNFGWVYVVNANPGTDGVRTTQKGCYVVNADMSDALGYSATAHPPTGSGANHIQYGSSTTYAPYRISVGPDDSVYIADASGATGVGTTVGGGVWLAGADLTTVTDLFTYNGTSGGPGLVCVCATPNVSGSVSANDLVLYTVEWNRQPYNNIWKYSMGGGPFPWMAAPVQLTNAGYPAVNEVLADLSIAPDGKFFASENRNSATGGNVSLWVYASDGLTYLWDSSSAAGGVDPFVGSYGVAVSPDGRYVATGTALGNLDLCQLTNGVPDLSTFTTITAAFSGTCQGVAWDAADNIYGVSGSNDLLRVFSLGLTTMAVTSNDTTGTNGSFQFIVSSDTPAIVSPPQNQTAAAGASAIFTVTASGAQPLSYQWSFNGTNLMDGGQVGGSGTSQLTLTNVGGTNAGSYRVVVTNSYGAVTSPVAVLTVTFPGSLTPSWSQLANSPGPNNVRHDDIYFTDALHGWASQNNYIYRTTDGGGTWTTCLYSPGTHFRSVGFATSQVGFAGNLGVGSYDGGTTDTNVLYRTYDGGTTWSNVPGFAEAGMQGLCSLYVLDAQHIFGGGRVRGPAFFVKSTDGGTNWSITSLTAMNVMNGIMDIYFRDPNNGWVVGMDTNAFAPSCGSLYYGRIARTSDGGSTWTTVVTTPISCSYFWKMSWPSTNIGYASLQQNGSFNSIIFYKTVDGGNNWVSNGIPLASVGLGSSAFYLQGIGFVSTTEGWIGGASGIAYSSSFLHTTDGGATWSPAGYDDTWYINRIRFLSPTLGFASGGNLHIYSPQLAIASQPQGQVVLSGANVSLNVSATGVPPLGYQWLKNGTNQPGATTAGLTMGNVTRLDAGTYSVIVTNPVAGLQSSNAVVRVLVPERLGSPTLLPGGGLQLLFSDADGGALLTTNDLATFAVLASTNLTYWIALTNTLSITNGQVLFQDSRSNFPARFYRIAEH